MVFLFFANRCTTATTTSGYFSSTSLVFYPRIHYLRFFFLTRRKHPTFLTLVQFLVTSGSHKAALLQFYSPLQNDRSLPKLETFGV